MESTIQRLQKLVEQLKSEVPTRKPRKKKFKLEDLPIHIPSKGSLDKMYQAYEVLASRQHDLNKELEKYQ